jgi:hypothetical protein
MPTRAEIVETLAQSQEQLFAHYRAMTPEELACICTESEVPDARPWGPKDHLAHLVLIERAFLRMIRATLKQKADPVGFSRSGSTNHDEIMAWINRQNQVYADTHHDDSLEVIIADVQAVRQESLDLLAQLTDEQLTIVVPGAPWSDGTISGLLFTNAHHTTDHMHWVDEGLHQHQDAV